MTRGGRRMSIVYGPVPSWRLGRSLGIDLLQGRGKTCCFDCVYCQLGLTTNRMVRRAEFVNVDDLARELAAVKGIPADYVTFSGTGEPTLASNLGSAIDTARREIGLPVAVLTNSALISREDVGADLAKADVVVAKLDAPSEDLFRLINRPAVDLSLKDIVDGIGRFRSQWNGRLALQMMFVAGNRDVASDMARIAGELAPDEVQLNTPLRPSAAASLSRQEMAAVRESFKGLPVRSVYEAVPPLVTPVDMEATLRRRPGPLGEREAVPD
jgi:wyosine [tRNA(Phe)-imidazoG37] synthetase (radical SAM superfamily)